MEIKMKDKVVLVTGSARGIGKAIAEKYLQEGASIIVADVLEEKAKETIIEFDVFGEYTLEGDMLILCYDNDPVCEEFTMTLSDDSYTNIFHVTDESSDRFGCIGEERAVRTQ